MSEYAATAVTYVICAIMLWRTTRRSTSRYVRTRWKKPYWILLRLLVLVLVFHGVFSLLGVHPGVGFPLVALSILMVLPFDLSGLVLVLVWAVGRAFYEWIFWLPSRRELILRTPSPVGKSKPSEYLGVEAVAVTDLKPAGTVAVDGVKRSARSDLGFISKGERVVVTSNGAFELTVRKVITEEGSPRRG